MKKFDLLKVALLLFVSFLTANITAQSNQDADRIALDYLKNNYAALGLTALDVENAEIVYHYTNVRSGAMTVHFNQLHNDTPIYNALLNLSIRKDGEVGYVGNRFIPNVAAKANATTASLNAYQAIQKAATQLGVSLKGELEQLEVKGTDDYVYSGGNISNSDIPVRLTYQPSLDGETLTLAWLLDIDMTNSADYWSVRVDAITGDIISKNNYTVYCNHQHGAFHKHTESCFNEKAQTFEKEFSANNLPPDNSSYRVFALPVESPAHGDRTLLSEPATDASPFGWHDTNGVEGAEFTITRGNNVHAYTDLNDTNTPGYSPDGGAGLVFDFPFDQNVEAIDQQDAAITQLFYTNNYLHDYVYNFGLDEASGNFQSNNYGNGGNGNDFVRAEGMDGGNILDEDHLNNANFSTPPDGNNGRMQMYLYNTGQRLLEISAPDVIAGFYAAGTADFGPAVDETPISGEIVLVEDEVEDPFVSDGCELPFVNAADLQGKIAMVDRGGCSFELKTANAEASGAIALIICNFEDGVIGMTGVVEVPEPGIPAISLASSDCALIKSYLNQGLNGTVAIPENLGPVYYDANFDNGVVAHEFGHGVSNRLTAGPNNSGCLGNVDLDGDDEVDGEQMGEGWSDWLALVASAEVGDTGADRRGMGTYLRRENVLGKGIRPFPYSTDMTINPVTYEDIVSLSVPHGVGSVWCSMVWDMYWLMVDEYGFDPDYTNLDAGNNKAVQLVMEGMRIQPCQPGFVDGRNAILEADMQLNNGDNQCLIWEAFARRGLGFNAQQGNSLDHRDGVADYEVLPTCIAELKITKTVDDLVDAGDEIDVELYIVNHKPETATNVVVTDIIPDGTTYVDGSSNITPTVNGNMLVFDLGDLAFEEQVNIEYELATDADLHSVQQFFDDFEEQGGDLVWVDSYIGDEPSNSWEIQEFLAYSGSKAYWVENIAQESHNQLIMLAPQTVQGDQPVLRFYQRLETQAGVDGGLIEISTDNANTWTNLGSKIFRYPYTGPIDYSTFVVPNLEAFWGNSFGWKATYVDLSDYAGQDVNIRFRFATNAGTGGFGWFIDNVEFMDMFNHNTEACVTSGEGDNACDTAPERGTVIESEFTTGVDELTIDEVAIGVFPNPTADVVNVSLTTQEATDISVSLISVNGQLMMTSSRQVFGQSIVSMNASALPKGIYFVKVQTAEGIATKKVIIE